MQGIYTNSLFLEFCEYLIDNLLRHRKNGVVNDDSFSCDGHVC